MFPAETDQGDLCLLVLSHTVNTCPFCVLFSIMFSTFLFFVVGSGGAGGDPAV